MTKTTTTKPPNSVGKAGVRLKQFEQVLTKIFTSLPDKLDINHDDNNSDDDDDTTNGNERLPRYRKLPSLTRCGISDALSNTRWPFNVLPPAACILGKSKRVWKKEAQIRSMLHCIFSMLPLCDGTKRKKNFKIVDFGGGSGNLGIPLAILLSKYRGNWNVETFEVVVVDLKRASLELARRRAYMAFTEMNKGLFWKGEDIDNDAKKVLYYETMIQDLYVDDTDANGGMPECSEWECQGLSNLKTYLGDIRSYNEQFDLGLALHACGEATDLAMNQCLKNNEAGFVVAPCCVGKLNGNIHNPYVSHSKRKQNIGQTRENIIAPTISYPRSCYFQKTLSISSNEFNQIASAGDYGEVLNMRHSRGACRRAAKTLLEYDRAKWAEESGYSTILTKMTPLDATPKNDILLGWKSTNISMDFCQLCTKSSSDILNARSHLIGDRYHEKYNQGDRKEVMLNDDNMVEWSLTELEEIKSALKIFQQNVNESEMRFPPGQGPRKRKLVHHLAETMGLKHFSIGSKKSERSVVVSKVM